MDIFREKLFSSMGNKSLSVSEWLVGYLELKGVKNSFSVTGGASMHLNDAFGKSKQINTLYMHHEQACAMAAESLARLERIPSAVVVTAGPGSLNTLTGVFGAFTDSIPMIVISGQARLDTLSAESEIKGLRQLGDQEMNTVSIVSPITKWSKLLKDPRQLLDFLDEAWNFATTNRPGPVWLDIPVNIQGASIKASEFTNVLKIENSTVFTLGIKEARSLINKLQISKRPLFLVGTGVSIENQGNNLLKLAEYLDIPIATAWSHDLIESDHRLFVGRPGTIGTRSGNFNLLAADLIFVIGSRLNVRQTGYNFDAFAPEAEIVWIDIDPNELAKDKVKVKTKFVSSMSNFFETMLFELSTERGVHVDWIEWCKSIQNRFDPKDSDYVTEPGLINPYHLIPFVFEKLNQKDVVVCGDATACIVPFQTAKIKKGMRMFSNSGCASMGYDLPAAIGASLSKSYSRTICFAGDGSIMMNLQEFQTIKQMNKNLIIFILENDGYLSIKQTQRNFFGIQYGSDSASGLSFPNFKSVIEGFELPVTQLDPVKWRDQIDQIISGQGPRVVIASLTVNQEFQPRIKSKMTENGIVTPPLDDMFPRINSDILESVRNDSKKVGY